MKNALIALLFTLTLAACATPDPKPAPMQLDYSSLGKIMLSTQSVRVINRAYAVPQNGTYIGHLFKPTIAEAVDRWASDRLQAIGNTGQTTLIIKDASLTTGKLAVDDGVEGWFTRQQGSKYVGRLELEIQSQLPDGSVGYATASAAHAVTLPEAPTEVEKYDAYKQVLNALMKDINQNLEKAMRDHMSKFIVTTPPAAAVQ